MTNKLGSANPNRIPKSKRTEEDRVNKILIEYAAKTSRKTNLIEECNGDLDPGSAIRIKAIDTDLLSIEKEFKKKYKIDIKGKNIRLPRTFEYIRKTIIGDHIVKLCGLEIILNGQQIRFIKHIKDKDLFQFKGSEIFDELNMKSYDVRLDKLFRNIGNIRDLIFAQSPQNKKGHWICLIETWINF